MNFPTYFPMKSSTFLKMAIPRSQGVGMAIYY